MKSQWECVIENLGEWVGSFTTVTPKGESIEDIPSIIKLEGIRDNQAIHLILKRFYPLPNSTETYQKEIVWDFSTPPGVGALYFETGAFSSGVLAANIGVKSIFEFSLIAGDRRFRMINTFDIHQQLDRVTFVREHRQGTKAPERPHLNISDLLGTWQGTSTTLYPDDQLATNLPTKSTFTTSDSGYQLIDGTQSLDLKVASGSLEKRLLEFIDNLDHQPYQILLLPDGGYTITPIKIGLGQPFYLEIGWVYEKGKRQRLVRRYDYAGKWENVTFITEQIASI
jgi:hypothetical protein